MGFDLAEEAARTLGLLCDVSQARAFLDQLHPDITWTIPGSWPGISGVKTYSDIERFMVKVFPAGFPNGIVADVHHVHVSGSTAVIEFTGTAGTAKNREYVNSYCFVFVFDGSKVIEIREYMDTLYADGVLHQ